MTFTVKTISEGTSAEHYAVWHNGRSICTSTCPQWAVRIANAMNAAPEIARLQSDLRHAQMQEDLHRDAAFSAEVEATCPPTAKLLAEKDAEIAKLRAMNEQDLARLTEAVEIGSKQAEQYDAEIARMRANLRVVVAQRNEAREMRDTAIARLNVEARKSLESAERAERYRLKTLEQDAEIARLRALLLRIRHCDDPQKGVTVRLPFFLEAAIDKELSTQDPK